MVSCVLRLCEGHKETEVERDVSITFPVPLHLETLPESSNATRGHETQRTAHLLLRVSHPYQIASFSDEKIR